MNGIDDRTDNENVPSIKLCYIKKIETELSW